MSSGTNDDDPLKDWTEGLPRYADAHTPEEIHEVARVWDERREQILRSAEQTQDRPSVQPPKGSVSAQDLPYPWPEGIDPMAHMGPTRAPEAVRAPGALAAGAALGYRGVSDSEWRPTDGLLAFYQDRFDFFIGDGRTWARPIWGLDYDSLTSFKLKRAGLGRGFGMRKLSMRGKDGSKLFFRIGPEMAANVNYILTVKKVSSG